MISMISFAATFGSAKEADGFCRHLARGVGAEAYKRRGLTVSFRVDVASWGLPAVKRIAAAVEAWGGQLIPHPDTIDTAQSRASGLFTAPGRGIWCKDHMPKPEDWFPGDAWRELSRNEVQRIAEESGEPVVCEDWELHDAERQPSRFFRRLRGNLGDVEQTKPATTTHTLLRAEAPAMPATTLDAVESLFLGSPWFPIRMGDRLDLTRGDVIVAAVRVVGNATIVQQVGQRGEEAKRVARFLEDRLALYRINDDPVTDSTLRQIEEANRDWGLSDDYYRRILALRVGESTTLDFGAGGVTVVRRIR